MLSKAKIFITVLVIMTQTAPITESSRITKWNRRSLLSVFDSLYGSCPQGPPETVTQETILNPHTWWESNWGRSGASWPRRGFQECWQNLDTVCPLPSQSNVVCVPGSRRGSTINRGWALDPKSQACKPGVHCLYACEPGYYWTTFNQGETSNYDFANAHQRGHCDGTWNYGTSTHGVYCKEDGTLALPPQPLCALGETFVFAENRLDKHVFLCQTVFPGHEIFMIPTLVKPGETVMITTQPMSWWHGPTFPQVPHGDIYVSFAGADIMEACTWDEFSPSGAALLPYEIGTGIEDNGHIYSTHYFYQQPNSEVPANMVGYTMDMECESSVPGVCKEKVRQGVSLVQMTLKKPPPGTTKVKFVFNKPGTDSNAYIYKEPNKPHIPDPMSITGLKANVQNSHRRSLASQGQTNRKLKSVIETKTYLENILKESIVVCEKENGVYLPGMSVGPGEVVQLPEDGSFFLGLKGESLFACSDTSNLHWVIDIDKENSSRNKSYSYKPLPNTGSDNGHLKYSIQLKCVSNNEDCEAHDGHKITIPVSSVQEQKPSVEVIFKIKGITNQILNKGSSKAGSSNNAYQWGSEIAQLIMSSRQLNKGNRNGGAIV